MRAVDIVSGRIDCIGILTRLHRPYSSGLRRTILIHDARWIQVDPRRRRVRCQSRASNLHRSAVGGGDLKRYFATAKVGGRNLNGSGSYGEFSPYCRHGVYPLFWVMQALTGAETGWHRSRKPSLSNGFHHTARATPPRAALQVVSLQPEITKNSCDPAGARSSSLRSHVLPVSPAQPDSATHSPPDRRRSSRSLTGDCTSLPRMLFPLATRTAPHPPR